MILQISNLPQPSLMSRATGYLSGVEVWLLTIPITMGLALAILLVWAWFRAPRAAPVTPGISPQDQARRQSLIQAIALLDARYEQGQVANGDYQPGGKNCWPSCVA